MTARKIAYLAATALLVVAFVGSGVANLLRVEHIAGDMRNLGYPSYFMSVLGTWKVLGALAVALPRWPRLKEWAYAGMFFDLTGAAISRAATHDELETILIPLMIVVVLFVSWRLRPASRMLAGATVHLEPALAVHRQEQV